MSVARAGAIERRGAVARLCLATDEAPHIGPAEARALAAAAAELAADRAVRAVVLCGGERSFCMGASRETLLADDAPARIATLMRELPHILLGLDLPVVAAMTGHAVGGGLAIGLWCDVTLLAEDSLYGANFVALGFTPGMGSTLLLEEAFGAPFARELLYTGRLVKGRELRDACAPLAAHVLPRAEVMARALRIADDIAIAPREVLVALKQALAGRRRARLAPVLHEEEAMHAALFADPATRRQIAEAYAGDEEDDG